MTRTRSTPAPAATAAPSEELTGYFDGGDAAHDAGATSRVPPVALDRFPDAGTAFAPETQLPPVDMTRQGMHQDQLDIAPAYTPRDMETAAFFEQVVTVYVHEGQEEGAVEMVLLNVNGEDCVIPRGRSVNIKRKFVQQLLDMRETKFTQPKRNSFNVEAGNRLIPRTTLLYPFSVEYDPHRNGLAWLQAEQRRIFSFSKTGTH